MHGHKIVKKLHGVLQYKAMMIGFNNVIIYNSLNTNFRTKAFKF